jgi:stage III sporulation protein AB
MYYCVKTILLFAIFSLSTGIGILISKMYENRVKELRQFKNILNIIKAKIKFTYEPLTEIFNQISQEKSSKIEEIFENMTYKLAFENVKYSWMDAIQEADISITQEDKDILKELGKVLGQTDADSQVNEIEVTESFLNMQIEKAEEARKKNQKMYKTLGIVVGLVFVIILI